MITKELFKSLPTFSEYFQSVQALYNEGKTTGSNQSAKFLDYTQLTIARTKRGLKTFFPSQEMIEIANFCPRKNWMVITEAWCGDAGNILPFISNLADSVESIELKVILRDEYPEIMDLFLTNGSRSIPILIAMDEGFNYVSHWGPRPAPAQQMVLENKRNSTKDYQVFQIELQKWYLQDKAKTLQKELIEYLSL